MNALLWVLQAALAIVFLLAGGSKLLMPLDVLSAQIALPGLLLRCIGAAEVLGALGLVLPGLLRIRPHLTPLAAAELAQLMLGATLFTWADSADIGTTLLPLTLGVLATVIAVGRRGWLAQLGAPRLALRAAAH